MSALWSTLAWLGGGIVLALLCFVLPVTVGRGIKAADDNLADPDFDQHVATALDLLDPATPHLGWPASVVPLRARHDRRGGAR